VLREEGRIVGTTAINRNPENSSIGFLKAIHGNKLKHLEKIIHFIKPICMDKGIQTVQMTFTHMTEDSTEIKQYKDLGFKRVKKEIN